MNTWGAQWLDDTFILWYTSLQMTVLLHKTAIVNFPMATTVSGAWEHIPTCRLVGTMFFEFFNKVAIFYYFFEVKRLFVSTKFENMKMSAPSSNTFSHHCFETTVVVCLNTHFVKTCNFQSFQIWLKILQQERSYICTNFDY